MNLNRLWGILLAVSLLLFPTLVFAAPTYLYVKTSGCGGDDSGDSWTNCLGHDEGAWETHIEALTTETDYYYFVMEGTYTLPGDFIVTGDGTVTLENHIIGVVSGTTNEPAVASDWATGTNRPLITDGASAYTFEVDNFWILRNLRVESGNTSSITVGISCRTINVKAQNDGAAIRDAITFSANNAASIDCEWISDNGYAVDQNGYGIFIGNYIHDSDYGVTADGSYSLFLYNIIDTCATAGLYFAANIRTHIINNIIYNCPTGIRATTAYDFLIYNNIIDTCTTKGISWDTTWQTSNIMDWNNFNGNTGGDVLNAVKGANATALDPQFEGAAGGDFDIGTNLKSSAFPGVIPGTTTCESHLDTGAVQRVEPAGNGSVTSGYGWAQ